MVTRSSGMAGLLMNVRMPFNKSWYSSHTLIACSRAARLERALFEIFFNTCTNSCCFALRFSCSSTVSEALIVLAQFSISRWINSRILFSLLKYAYNLKIHIHKPGNNSITSAPQNAYIQILQLRVNAIKIVSFFRQFHNIFGLSSPFEELL